MTKMDNIMDPERYGIWIAASFIIALLALVVAIVGISRTSDLMYMTQVEALLMNKKVEVLQPSAPAPAATDAAQK